MSQWAPTFASPISLQHLEPKVSIILSNRKEVFTKLSLKKMQEEGTVLIQQQPLNDGQHVLPSFFRLTLKSEKSTIEDMDYLLEEIDRLG